MAWFAVAKVVVEMVEKVVEKMGYFGGKKEEEEGGVVVL